MRSQEKDFADGLNRGWLNRQLKEDENVIWIGKPVPGTITFGREPVEISLVYCRIRMPFYQREKREPVFYLEDVPDVEKVYRIITEQVMNEQ